MMPRRASLPTSNAVPPFSEAEKLNGRLLVRCTTDVFAFWNCIAIARWSARGMLEKGTPLPIAFCRSEGTSRVPSSKPVQSDLLP